jgi:two-component system cell cycle sensor histidine kinase/response regulator CckA
MGSHSSNAELERIIADQDKVITHLDTLIKSNPGMVCIATPEGRFKYLNPEWERVLGHRPDEMLTKSIFDLLHPEDQSVTGEKLASLQDDTSTLQFENRLLCSDGSYKWLEWKIVPSGSDELYCTVLDISDRKEFEATLIKAKKQWQETFDAVTDWVSIIDANHNIWRSNLASDNFLDLSTKQLPGKKCYEVVHKTSCAIAGCPLRRAVKTGKREEMEIQLEDGRWVHVSIDPIRNGQDGNLFVHIVRDISRQKIAEKQVIASKKAEAFSVLSAGIAHDFNNLLAVIWGTISLLREDALDASQREMFTMAETACKQAKSLTDQFIMLSKGFAPQKSLFPIAEILQSGIDWIPAMHGIQITLDVPDPSPRVELDSELFIIALKNILSNAVEAMPDGGTLQVVAEIQSTPTENQKARDRLELRFTDTGRGISRADLPDIYDPYFSTKDFGINKGSGLGLAVAHSIVKKHDGDIQIESETGRGTTVRIILPLAQEWQTV